MTWAERWIRATSTPRLLVVGGASLDRIHVGGRTVDTPGGAGLYTALAAARAGVEVTMLAPLPDPMPTELAPALDRIRWVGPVVPVSGLPRFEIAYDDHGAVTLFHEYLGAEPDMSPRLLDLIDDLPSAAFCVPFMNARLQREFVGALRDRGCLTITTTYGKAVRLQPDLVRDTLDLVDLSFCNDGEAAVLFPRGADAPAGCFRFVTRGERGASVFQGDHRTDVDGVRVDAVDPTGAGDTFCGTTIARILLGDHPVEAARNANAAAGEMVGAIGPSALLRPGPPPLPASDDRVIVDESAVARMGELIGGLGDLRPFPFTGELFPEIGDPMTIDWFAAATLGQFGFWFETDGTWERSMIATLDGVERKGSDYLWAVYRRWAAADPDALRPERLGLLGTDSWSAVASDDGGSDPFPASTLHADLVRSYGRTLVALHLDPDEIVAIAAASTRPVRSLMTLLDHVGGYREDPLRKKSALLAVILRQRPERFLPDATDDEAPPIVDYHVQRSCLRTGMVDVVDRGLRTDLVARRVIPPNDESAVRRACAAAVGRLCRLSGRDMGTVDWFLFAMRHHCPEAVPPDCASCPAESACARHTELFQPVIRTTAY
ncbi:MAG: carbohydrate kinase family protein [Ilumatobacteraceae bacterium]